MISIVKASFQHTFNAFCCNFQIITLVSPNQLEKHNAQHLPHAETGCGNST
jgi:hypothetical protein